MGTDSNFASHSSQADTDSRAGSGLAGLVVGAATLCIAMLAGIFFDWAINIMPALSDADDRTFVIVMQKTITTMTNGPLFLFTIMGGLVFTGVAAILLHRLGARAAVRWTVAALLLYVVSMMITAGVHFPLNDTLENAGDPDTIADIAGLREDTESSWVGGHVLRTIASIAALACLCRALWMRGAVTSARVR